VVKPSKNIIKSTCGITTYIESIMEHIRVVACVVLHVIGVVTVSNDKVEVDDTSPNGEGIKELDGGGVVEPAVPDRGGGAAVPAVLLVGTSVLSSLLPLSSSDG